ncbi:MAG: hypothetical protein Q9188_004265 [Gyalolechia gomerana]
MPVNWKDSKAFERLLAAMVAAQEMKLDYRKIATMYGEGATYDAIEGRFRIIKREAAKLLGEVESGARPAAPPRGSSNTAKSSFTTSEDGDVNALITPKKARKPRSTNTTPRARKGDKVIAGRVTKAEGTSPVKKNGSGNMVKGIKEEFGSGESSLYEDAGMEVDAESVAEGLGFDGPFDFGIMGEMEA